MSIKDVALTFGLEALKKEERRKMKKNLRKNKKGFTLVEIIVVLLIIGILLAITIPSIMGYVGKAQDAAIEAKARSGYVAAQSIVAREVAKGKTLAPNGDTPTITGAAVTTELGEDTDKATIAKAGCAYEGNNIKKCAFVTKDSSKVVVFDVSPDTTKDEDPTRVYSSESDQKFTGEGINLN